MSGVSAWPFSTKTESWRSAQTLSSLVACWLIAHADSADANAEEVSGSQGGPQLAMSTKCLHSPNDGDARILTSAAMISAAASFTADTVNLYP